MTDVDVYSRTQRAIAYENRNTAPFPPEGGICSGHDTSWWFPTFGMNKDQLEKQKKAIEICQTCPVRKKCLEYSIQWEAFGIWGGFTERQRDAIRRRFNIRHNRVGLANSRATNTYNQIVNREEQNWLIQNGF